MKLGKKTLEYFDIQRKQYNGPVCIVYIDAHGLETMEESCIKDATIFSFAGISGALTFLKKQVRDGEEVPSSVYYRDIIKNIKPTDTRQIKEATKEMAHLIKPQLSRHFDSLPSIPIVNWSRDNFEEYALTPMKQLKHKKYEFFDPSKKDFFDFGIFILDVIYPPGHPPDEQLENLKGQNIISRYFEEFPAASEYLEKLSKNSSNTKYIAKYPEPNILRIITFKEIIHLLSLFGFEYSYIFDDSCRENDLAKRPTEENMKELKKLAKRERNVSLKKLSFKMLTADKPKTRRRLLSELSGKIKSSLPRARVKDLFHEKIETYLSDKLDEIKDDLMDNEEIYAGDIFLTISKDTHTELNFVLSVMGEDVLYINILIDFLKIDSIHVRKSKTTSLINNLVVKPFIKELKNLKKDV